MERAEPESTRRLPADYVAQMIHAQAAIHGLEKAGGLVGVTGLAELWGWSRQYVDKITKREDFPASLPIAGSDVQVWVMIECQTWRALRYDS